MSISHFNSVKDFKRQYYQKGGKTARKQKGGGGRSGSGTTQKEKVHADHKLSVKRQTWANYQDFGGGRVLIHKGGGFEYLDDGIEVDDTSVQSDEGSWVDDPLDIPPDDLIEEPYDDGPLGEDGGGFYNRLSGEDGLRALYKYKSMGGTFETEDYIRAGVNKRFNRVNKIFGKANRGKTVDPRKLYIARTTPVAELKSNKFIALVLEHEYGGDVAKMREGVNFIVIKKRVVGLNFVGEMKVKAWKVKYSTRMADRQHSREIKRSQGMVSLLGVVRMPTAEHTTLANMILAYQYDRLARHAQVYLGKLYPEYTGPMRLGTAKSRHHIKHRIVKTLSAYLRPKFTYTTDLTKFTDPDLAGDKYSDTHVRGTIIAGVVTVAPDINGNNGSYTNTDDHRKLTLCFVGNMLGGSYYHLDIHDIPSEVARGVIIESLIDHSTTDTIDLCYSVSNPDIVYLLSPIRIRKIHNYESNLYMGYPSMTQRVLTSNNTPPGRYVFNRMLSTWSGVKRAYVSTLNLHGVYQLLRILNSARLSEFTQFEELAEWDSSDQWFWYSPPVQTTAVLSRPALVRSVTIHHIDAMDESDDIEDIIATPISTPTPPPPPARAPRVRDPDLEAAVEASWACPPMFGPEYSCDNSGDGPKVHANACTNPKCRKKIHYHKRSRPDKSKDNPAKKRKDAQTAKEKKDVLVDLRKDLAMCTYGCAQPGHYHLGGRQENVVSAATFHPVCMDLDSPDLLDKHCGFDHLQCIACDLDIDEINNPIGFPTFAELSSGYEMEYGVPLNVHDDPNSDEDADYVEAQVPASKRGSRAAGNKVIKVPKFEPLAITTDLTTLPPPSVREQILMRNVDDDMPDLIDDDDEIEIVFKRDAETQHDDIQQLVDHAQLVQHANAQNDVIAETGAMLDALVAELVDKHGDIAERDRTILDLKIVNSDNEGEVILAHAVAEKQREIADLARAEVDRLNEVIETYDNTPLEIVSAVKAEQVQVHLYGIIQSGTCVFTAKLDVNNHFASTDDQVHTMWKLNEDTGCYYSYMNGNFHGNPWPYEVIEEGSHNNIEYLPKSFLARTKHSGSPTLLQSELITREILVEAQNIEWFRHLRTNFTQFVKSLDLLRRLDNTVWDPRSVDYLRRTRYLVVTYSRSIWEKLMHKSLGTGFTDVSMQSLYTRIGNEHPRLPPGLIADTILAFAYDKLATTMNTCATSNAMIDNYKINVGDHMRRQGVCGVTYAGRVYAERVLPNDPAHGWRRYDKLAELDDPGAVVITDPFKVTDGQTHGDINNLYHLSSVKFEVMHSKECRVIGDTFEFVGCTLPREYEPNLRRCLYATIHSKFSVVNHKDPNSMAIATLRFRGNRVNELEKRNAQRKLAHCSLIILGKMLYKEYGVAALYFLDETHEDVVSMIHGSNTDVSYSVDSMDPKYDFGQTGLRGQYVKWVDRKADYDGIVDRDYYDSLVDFYKDEMFVQFAWLTAAQHFSAVMVDTVITEASIKHMWDTPNACDEYFNEIGGPKLKMRLQQTADIRAHKDEKYTVTTNTVNIKPHEIQKLKIAKFGPKKGTPDDQYSRTVVSIVGKSYIDACPDLINKYKKTVAHHPLHFTGYEMHILDYDKDTAQLSHSGQTLRLPFKVPRHIIICAAIDDANSADFGVYASVMERYCKTLEGEYYLAFSFGDDMLAHTDKDWHEADVSNNDGSYTDAISRITMYISAILTFQATNPAWAQRARPYSFRAPSGKGIIIFRSIEGINLPSGSNTTTLQCTTTSQTIHIGIGLSGSRQWAQDMTGFDLSGLEHKEDSTAVGFLSNILSHELSDDTIHCIQHPGVILRSFGFSKESEVALATTYRAYKRPDERGYITTALNVLSHAANYVTMRERVDFPPAFRDIPVITRTPHKLLEIDTYAVPTFICAMGKLLVNSRPKTLSGVTYSHITKINWNLKTLANEYDIRVRKQKYDYTDWAICSAYSTVEEHNMSMCEMFDLYLDFCKSLTNPTGIPLYGAYFGHHFADIALNMRYGSLVSEVWR